MDSTLLFINIFIRSFSFPLVKLGIFPVLRGLNPNQTDFCEACQNWVVNPMVFQKFLKQNQTLKYEKSVSYWVQIWYFEQYSLDIEWERPFLRILTWLQVFKLFAKTLLSLIFPRLLFCGKLIKTEKNNTVLLSVLLQNWY